MLLEVVVSDIAIIAAEPHVDAVVCPTNRTLVEGGPAALAIHRAAGPALARECLKLVSGLPCMEAEVGAAYATGPGNLSCRHVIHVPAPVYYDGCYGEPELLARCYYNCLKTADRLGCRSVAFPCIATGMAGYPMEDAARIAVKTVLSFASDMPCRVVFCCFAEEDAAIYRRLLQEAEWTRPGMRMPQPTGDAVDSPSPRRTGEYRPASPLRLISPAPCCATCLMVFNCVMAKPMLYDSELWRVVCDEWTDHEKDDGR